LGIDNRHFLANGAETETAVQGYINTVLTTIIMFAAVLILIDSIRRLAGPTQTPEAVGDLAEASSTA